MKANKIKKRIVKLEGVALGILDDLNDIRMELKAKKAKSNPLYKEGEVFWSKSLRKVFVATGSLCRPDGSYIYPDARILKVKVFKLDDDLYIHDGGSREKTKAGIIYAFGTLTESVARRATEQDVVSSTGERRKLVKLKEVK